MDPVCTTPPEERTSVAVGRAGGPLRCFLRGEGGFTGAGGEVRGGGESHVDSMDGDSKKVEE